MKRLGAIGAAVLALSAMTACTSLKPGRCNQDGDCQSGFRCDLDPTPQGNGRCVAITPGDGGGVDGHIDGAGGDAIADGSKDVPGRDGAAGGGGRGDAGVETKPTCTAAQCTGTTPICSSDGLCHACAVALAGADAGVDGGTDAGAGQGCAKKNAALPVCAASGACVECVASSDCVVDPTNPICDTTTNTCVKCATDAQCVAKLGANPGVCMAHQDGRCAIDGETIYVQNVVSSCKDAMDTTAGTVVQPLCTLQPVGSLVAPSRRLVLIRGVVQAGTWTLQSGGTEVSFVGQATAAVAGAGPALHVSGSSAYVRAIEFSAPFDIGIWAEMGSTLRADTVLVDNCKGGGILLDQSNFDIRNTTLTGNGPGTSGTTTWGGILINMPPSIGPATLELDTIIDNKGPGLSCSAAVTATGTLATGNSTLDASPTCNVTLCTPASSTCGASSP